MLSESRKAFFEADKTDVLVFIGRFQPFHNGHKAVVDQALQCAERVALVIGSHDQPRNARNPFTTAERIAMISAVYPDEVAAGRIQFVPQADHTYNHDRWIAGVTTGVETVAAKGGWRDMPRRIGLIGHEKDHSSFYLKFFPQWGNIGVDNVAGIGATAIRGTLFSSYVWSVPRKDLPKACADWLQNWMEENHDIYLSIVDEMDFVEKYKRQFADAPYPPIFHTTDAIVVQSGHILLVERGAQPGKGLWALPGGFLNADETLLDGVIRELREETRIAVPDPVLRGSIVAQRPFDDPHRSLRGRTITTAFHMRLMDREDLPKIKGSDDAAKARWVPLADVRRSEMYEDHYDIVEAMVGL